MNTKRGRPKIDNPKDIDLKVRVNRETHDKLLMYSKTNNITKAEAVRQGIQLLLGQKK